METGTVKTEARDALNNGAPKEIDVVSIDGFPQEGIEMLVRGVAFEELPEEFRDAATRAIAMYGVVGKPVFATGLPVALVGLARLTGRRDPVSEEAANAAIERDLVRTKALAIFPMQIDGLEIAVELVLETDIPATAPTEEQLRVGKGGKLIPSFFDVAFDLGFPFVETTKTDLLATGFGGVVSTLASDFGFDVDTALDTVIVEEYFDIYASGQSKGERRAFELAAANGIGENDFVDDVAFVVNGTRARAFFLNTK